MAIPRVSGWPRTNMKQIATSGQSFSSAASQLSVPGARNLLRAAAPCAGHLHCKVHPDHHCGSHGQAAHLHQSPAQLQPVSAASSVIPPQSSARLQVCICHTSLPFILVLHRKKAWNAIPLCSIHPLIFHRASHALSDGHSLPSFSAVSSSLVTCEQVRDGGCALFYPHH